MTMPALLLTSLLAAAGPLPEPAARGWSELLQTHVSDKGLVDYRAIAAKDLGKLDAFLAAVAGAKVPEARDEALAFYGDAYNALVIRAVITAQFPRSVLDVKGFFDTKTYRVAGQTVTLDTLEKKLAAPLGVPGHHFVFVCGAVGCPKLGRTPLSGSDVRARMKAAARAYLATPRGAVVKAGSLELSKIFEWYAADFGGAAGVLAFARENLPADAAAKLGATPKVSSLEYDWTLNQP